MGNDKWVWDGYLIGFAKAVIKKSHFIYSFLQCRGLPHFTNQ